MANNPVCLKVDAADVAHSLEAAGERLDSQSEVVLDFSSVQRIDAAALRAMEKLTGVAHDQAVKVVVHGVNVDVYKVLKLSRIAPRLSFST